MYFNIHSVSCAPAKRDLPSLATVCSQTLRGVEDTVSVLNTDDPLAGRLAVHRYAYSIAGFTYCRAEAMRFVLLILSSHRRAWVR